MELWIYIRSLSQGQLRMTQQRHYNNRWVSVSGGHVAGAYTQTFVQGIQREEEERNFEVHDISLCCQRSPVFDREFGLLPPGCWTKPCSPTQCTLLGSHAGFERWPLDASDTHPVGASSVPKLGIWAFQHFRRQFSLLGPIPISPVYPGASNLGQHFNSVWWLFYSFFKAPSCLIV